MLLRKRIAKKLLLILIISLTASCVWKNRPYVGDYENSQIIHGSGSTVSCHEESFNNFVCWDYDDVSELLRILDKCNVITQSERKKMKKALKKRRD